MREEVLRAGAFWCLFWGVTGPMLALFIIASVVKDNRENRSKPVRPGPAHRREK